MLAFSAEIPHLRQHQSAAWHGSVSDPRIRSLRLVADGVYPVALTAPGQPPASSVAVSPERSFDFSTTFQNAGRSRSLELQGLDETGAVVASETYRRDVIAEKPVVQIRPPSAAVVGSDWTIKGYASPGIQTLALQVDGFAIGQVPVGSDGAWQRTYQFTQPGAARG